MVSRKQKKISEKIEGKTGLAKWYDWKWQIKNRIRDIATFERLTGIKFEDAERKALEKTLEEFPLSITPYYASLINPRSFRNDPVFRQSFPDPRELVVARTDIEDPLDEDKDSPAECITHRYPDRVLFIVSNICSMYCRHCTRKRRVGDVDSIPSGEQLEKGISYIRENKEVRDVLLSGGDPLMLPDSQIKWLLSELGKIKHLEVVRIGTRMPVVLPYRITMDLVEMLRKFQDKWAGNKSLWINTHFNHPRELTKSSRVSLKRIADAGIPLGNQSVLLAEVNDCPRIIKKLVQRLVQNRVRPYYLYQCDLSEGLTHFRTPIGKGIEIMEYLIGHTSGFAVPRYVVDAPGGGGKIPIMPNYILSRGTNKVVLRNYEGVITTYVEPENYDSNFCDRNCRKCRLHLKLDPAEEYHPVGITKLLSDFDKTVSIAPEHTERIDKREKNGTD